MVDTFLLMSKDKNAETENTTPGDTTPSNLPESLQKMLVVPDENTNGTSVSLLLPQKNESGIELPEANLGTKQKAKLSTSRAFFQKATAIGS